MKKSTPKLTSSQEYLSHTKELRWASSLVRRKMQDLAGPMADAYADAFVRLKRERPADADAIEAYVVAQGMVMCALNEALYRECERRALSPARIAAKGGKRKAKTSPTAPAKELARQLWRNRDDWTAIELWNAIQRKHAVSLDTVRKWVTKLHATGTC